MFTSGMMATVYLGNFIVAGILHPISFINAQQLNNQAVKIFCSGTDDDLFWGDLQSVKCQKVICNGLAKGENSTVGSNLERT